MRMRTGMHSGLSALALATVALGGVPSWADSAPPALPGAHTAEDDCAGNVDSISIAGCTTIISSGKYEGAVLAAVYVNRGAAYDNLGQYDRALADYNQAIKLKPDYGEVYGIRAIIYFKRSQYARAIQDMDLAIRFKPDDADDYTIRGAAYYKLGLADLAEADKAKAHELDPKQ